MSYTKTGYICTINLKVYALTCADIIKVKCYTVGYKTRIVPAFVIN